MSKDLNFPSDIADARGRGLSTDSAPWPNRKTVRFTLDVDADLHTRMKVACAMRGEKMSDVLRTVLAKEFPLR